MIGGCDGAAGSLQRYTARVTSMLPVLMSAIRTAPLAGGFPSADALGKTWVTYAYNQVRPRRVLHFNRCLT